MTTRRGSRGARRQAAPCRAQHGFTLIELMVSLTILSIGILSVARVFSSVFTATNETGNRTRGVALATRDAETLRAASYDRVGFSATQTGWVDAFEGASSVQVADPALTPVSTVASGGITYSFERHLTWTDAAAAQGGGSYHDAYKHAAVLVRWTDQGGAHLVRQDAIVYPGGMGAYSGPQSNGVAVAASVAVAPPTPLSLLATVPPVPLGTSGVDLSWTAVAGTTPVSSWVVQYSADGFATVTQATDTQPATTTSFGVTGLSAATAYSFRVAAMAADGTLSTFSGLATATTLPALVVTCQAGTIAVTPPAVRRSNGTSTILAADPVLTVNTSGSCVGVHASYQAVAGIPASLWLANATGGTWSGTLPGTTTGWDTGTHTLTVLDQAGATLGTVSLTVCVHNAKTCP